MMVILLEQWEWRNREPIYERICPGFVNPDVLDARDLSLKELSKSQKESEELNWNDKKKLEKFLMKQQEQEVR